MIIPHFWAEARLQNKQTGKQVTIRRWGWSDTSAAEAQALANQRAQEAMERALNGENIRRQEGRWAYDGDDGRPIREEIVSVHGQNVITRNSYGSLCLNTPNVFFADLDAQWPETRRFSPIGCLLIFATAIGIGVWQHSFLLGAAIAIGVPWLWAQVVNAANARSRPGKEEALRKEALASVHRFIALHPDWHLRVYETPAGYRLLAMHDVFEPRGERAQQALEELQSDRRFATLCALQSCFRARVSPKYWRTGYRPQKRLPRTRWPLSPEQLTVNREWVQAYNEHAQHFASCRFVERLGSPTVHPEAEAVRAIHDMHCRSDSDLPIA